MEHIYVIFLFLKNLLTDVTQMNSDSCNQYYVCMIFYDEIKRQLKKIILQRTDLHFIQIHSGSEKCKFGPTNYFAQPS